MVKREKTANCTNPADLLRFVDMNKVLLLRKHKILITFKLLN